ncbi:siderophore-interacting protein [Scrofimicrobium canadense]|nr:SIP domain-containing protein [Scrofimicrobium canadense]
MHSTYATRDCRQAPSEESNANIHWIIRSELDTVPGQAVLAAVIESGIPTEGLYTYAVGEQALAAGVRRYLANERGVPKNDISFIGYWREGRSSPS